MADQLNPKTRVINGRTCVNRDWIMQKTRAKLSTAKRWYAKREEQPEEARHPEKTAKIDRVDYYDLEKFMAFFTAHEERKLSTVLPTDPDLYTGSPEDWIDIHQATALFNFNSTSVIYKYLAAFPGYFAKPVGYVEGPSGRPIPAFLRKDLQKFDVSRSGEPLGVGVGRQPKPEGPAQHSAKDRFRIAEAHKQMERSGGWYRGIAKELAETHDELKSVASWRKAVRHARMEREHQDDQPQ
ncbi:hypothetical protein [Streptomyces lydicus]|uniref:hypothetical protein n=1 Tax=Streptomyces lydicus TaxID=47763 RepID=UPI0036EAE459